MNKQLFIEWTVRVLVLMVLGVGIFMAHRSTIALKQQRSEVLQQLERSPSRVLEAAAQQADLARHNLDISRIKNYLIARSDIAGFVAAVESEGKRRSLTVQVPEIKEVLDKAAGSTADVTVHVSVDGSPEQIVAFAHSLENLPYVVVLDTWLLSGESVVAGQNAVLQQQSRQEPNQPPAFSEHSEFTFILSLRSDV